jgi:hypothetical protein
MNTKIIGSLVAFTLLLLFPPLVLAQQTAQAEREPKTKLEGFQAQTGAVVIKGYSVIGRVVALGSVEVNAMEFTDATTGRKQSGVLIEIKESGRLENTDRSFIDYEEVDALLKGIDYISKVTSDVTKLSMFEATYKTKGYFSATAYSSSRPGKIEATLKSGYIRPASAYLSLQQLAELRALIEQAKQKLDSVK